MIFKGKENKSLELEITGYEYPYQENFKQDLNWLMVYTKFHNGYAKRKFKDPCLQTTEIQEIIDWLDELSKDKITKKELSFIEPLWGFHLMEFTEDTKTIGIIIDLLEPWEVEMDVTNLELKELAEDLARELEKFPTRYLDEK